MKVPSYARQVKPIGLQDPGVSGGSAGGATAFVGQALGAAAQVLGGVADRQFERDKEDMLRAARDNSLAITARIQDSFQKGRTLQGRSAEQSVALFDAEFSKITTPPPGINPRVWQMSVDSARESYLSHRQALHNHAEGERTRSLVAQSDKFAVNEGVTAANTGAVRAWEGMYNDQFSVAGGLVDAEERAGFAMAKTTEAYRGAHKNVLDRLIASGQYERAQAFINENVVPKEGAPIAGFPDNSAQVGLDAAIAGAERANVRREKEVDTATLQGMNEEIIKTGDSTAAVRNAIAGGKLSTPMRLALSELLAKDVARKKEDTDLIAGKDRLRQQIESGAPVTPAFIATLPQAMQIEYSTQRLRESENRRETAEEIAAIRTVTQIHAEGKTLTDEQRQSMPESVQKMLAMEGLQEAKVAATEEELNAGVISLGEKLRAVQADADFAEDVRRTQRPLFPGMRLPAARAFDENAFAETLNPVEKKLFRNRQRAMQMQRLADEETRRAKVMSNLNDKQAYVAVAEMVAHPNFDPIGTNLYVLENVQSDEMRQVLQRMVNARTDAMKPSAPVYVRALANAFSPGEDGVAPGLLYAKLSEKIDIADEDGQAALAKQVAIYHDDLQRRLSELPATATQAEVNKVIQEMANHINAAPTVKPRYFGLTADEIGTAAGLSLIPFGGVTGGAVRYIRDRYRPAGSPVELVAPGPFQPAPTGPTAPVLTGEPLPPRKP